MKLEHGALHEEILDTTLVLLAAMEMASRPVRDRSQTMDGLFEDRMWMFEHCLGLIVVRQPMADRYRVNSISDSET